MKIEITEDELSTLLDALADASFEYDKGAESYDASGLEEDAQWEFSRARAADDLEHKIRKQVGR